MAPSKSSRVIIIGAGICGLTIAQGLKKAGVQFTIFEAAKRDPRQSKDWNMGLHWGVPILKDLLPESLVSKLDSVVSLNPVVDETANRTISIYDGKTGELIKHSVMDDPFLRVRRRQLKALCEEGMDVLVSQIYYLHDPIC